VKASTLAVAFIEKNNRVYAESLWFFLHAKKIATLKIFFPILLKNVQDFVDFFSRQEHQNDNNYGVVKTVAILFSLLPKNRERKHHVLMAVEEKESVCKIFFFLLLFIKFIK